MEPITYTVEQQPVQVTSKEDLVYLAATLYKAMRKRWAAFLSRPRPASDDESDENPSLAQPAQDCHTFEVK